MYNFTSCLLRGVIPVYQRNYDWRIEECKELKTEIDRMVYALYALSEEEIRLVEGENQPIITDYN